MAKSPSPAPACRASIRPRVNPMQAKAGAVPPPTRFGGGSVQRSQGGSAQVQAPVPYCYPDRESALALCSQLQVPVFPQGEVVQQVGNTPWHTGFYCRDGCAGYMVYITTQNAMGWKTHWYLYTDGYLRQ